jgi:hypothetical protein
MPSLRAVGGSKLRRFSLLATTSFSDWTHRPQKRYSACALNAWQNASPGAALTSSNPPATVHFVCIARDCCGVAVQNRDWRLNRALRGDFA